MYPADQASKLISKVIFLSDIKIAIQFTLNVAIGKIWWFPEGLDKGLTSAWLSRLSCSVIVTLQTARSIFPSEFASFTDAARYFSGLWGIHHYFWRRRQTRRSFPLGLLWRPSKSGISEGARWLPETLAKRPTKMCIADKATAVADLTNGCFTF